MNRASCTSPGRTSRDCAKEKRGGDSPETSLGASLYGNSSETSYGMDYGDSSQPPPRASPNVDVQTENIHYLQVLWASGSLVL
ncbi:hypothetical protein LguiB_005675 [Lonicera macranthoides]